MERGIIGEIEKNAIGFSLAFILLFTKVKSIIDGAEAAEPRVNAVSLLAMYVLVRSPFGRSLAGIRERELRMQILGYNTWLHKYIAFVIAGAFGGLSGVLWAHTAGIVSPENVVLTTSVDALLMAVLGGAGTLVGGVIGAFIVFFLREYLSTVVWWWQYVLGGVYVLTILYLPGGLMSIPALIRQRRGAAGKPAEATKLVSAPS